MILTGKQIERQLGKGLDIQPYDPKQLNPNSYNLRLDDELLIYEKYEITKNNHGIFIGSCSPRTLDMAKENPYRIIRIPETGLVLEPGTVYLGRTKEWTRTDKFVPMLEGRSSVGRLGISIHATAGFGDIGFHGYWTLEISCIQPVKIYPGVEICQIYYHTIGPDDMIWIPDDGNPDILTYKDGKYQDNYTVQPSMMWKEFIKE